jgi:hypothetical protein
VVEEEERSLPPPEEVEAVSSPSFSIWSFLGNDSERNLEDDEDAATKTHEDSLHLEWWEEAKGKAEVERTRCSRRRRRCLPFYFIRTVYFTCITIILLPLDTLIHLFTANR